MAVSVEYAVHALIRAFLRLVLINCKANQADWIVAIVAWNYFDICTIQPADFTQATEIFGLGLLALADYKDEIVRFTDRASTTIISRGLRVSRHLDAKLADEW